MLFRSLTPPVWVTVNRDLWPLIHGGEFPGEPMADWLWQVLVEMGIYASLAVEVKRKPTRFATFDDAWKSIPVGSGARHRPMQTLLPIISMQPCGRTRAGIRWAVDRLVLICGGARAIRTGRQLQYGRLFLTTER